MAWNECIYDDDASVCQQMKLVHSVTHLEPTRKVKLITLLFHIYINLLCAFLESFAQSDHHDEKITKQQWFLGDNNGQPWFMGV